MAPISPGPARLQRKAKKPTETTNMHRYESFTRRISRLKIDPVHTVERRKPSNDEGDLTQSYFRTALDEWAELNLSQTFTSFLNKASPLSENIPQLLHHADTIFDLLIQHIEKKDALALEPLLSLIAHLAHDLGSRFEQSFSKTVTLVARVAASHDSAEVIEWCFTCLAWMFKYLSRLLVQDLRPLLDIMTPYLASKKEYVVRFSAESLAFLLRKAAVMYQKKKTPLTLALKHLLGEEISNHDSPAAMHSYQIGAMSLCVESARGLEGSLHSSADSLVRCLLDVVVPICEQELARTTVEGVLIALIHETNSVGFQPVLDVVLDTVRQCTTSHEQGRLSFALRLLNVMFGTRKGSRIVDWKVAIQTYLDIAQVLQERSETRSQVRRELVAISALTIGHAPMDQLLPYVQKVLKSVTEQFSASDFFAFCTICAELDKERFSDLVLPTLQQYIVSHWSDDEVGTHYSLEKLRRDGVLSTKRGGVSPFDCPSDMQSFLAQELAVQNADDVKLPLAKFAGRLRLPHNARFPQESEHIAKLLPIYRELILHSLQEVGTEPNLRRRAILGWGFETYLDIVTDVKLKLDDLPQHVLNTSPAHFRLPSFLSMSNRLLERVSMKPAVEERKMDSVRHVLIQNMLSTSIPLKKQSLSLLSRLEVPDTADWLAETVGLMLELLDAPYTPSEARKITMLLRRLPQRQKRLNSGSVVENLLPFFCLGLLSHYYDRTRQEVCQILAQMVEATSVEESVVNTAIQWLQTPSPLSEARQDSDNQPRAIASAFQCTNLSKVDLLCETTLADFDDSDKGLLKIVQDDHVLENARTPESGRSLALQVLSSVSASAERRSRLLVPIFLSAPMTRSQVQQQATSDTSASSNTLSPDIDDSEWSLSDRKAFLTLFSKFVNPRVLFRSSDVHTKLVGLLSNGNLDVRKLALQAVLTWKEPALIRHESVLHQVAEDKSSTTDLRAFLSAEEDESTIKSEDRGPVLPVLLRLIFGLIVGRAGTTGSQEARRKAIIRTLFNMKEEEIAIFLDIALGTLRDVKIGQDDLDLLSQNIVVAEDQQYGYLRLLLSILETLQSRFAPYGEQVIPAVIYCVTRASQQGASVVSNSSSGLARNIRRVGFQCLVLLSQNCPGINWSQYLPTLFAEAISPRLEIFSSETNQGISGLVRLFSSWTRSNETIGFLEDYDERVTDVLWQSLSAQSAQKEVKAFILQEIVQPWLGLAEDESVSPNRGRELFEVKSDGLLDALVLLLDPTPPKEILSAITSILPRIAPFAKSSRSKQATIRLLTSLLRDTSHRIPPNIKSQLLLSIDSFLNATDELGDNETQSQLLGTVSSLFDYFKDESNRQVLCRVLANLSKFDADLKTAALICQDLHAVSTERLGEIDYDRRLGAFQTIGSLEVDNSSEKTWRPIVYSLLFFVWTTEDFSIRSNALSCLKDFIIKAGEAQSPDIEALVKNVVLPSVKRGFRAESELVRADFVSVYGLLVQHVRNDPDLENLSVLLVGNDEEASFFSNILHIQQHRRLRAIRRLVSEVEKGIISAQNISELFIPLLEMFVYDVGNDETGGTKGQSILAMGTLVQSIDWKHFKTLFRKYKNDIDSTNGDQKPTTRLLGHAADALLSAARYQPDNAEQKPMPHLAKSLPDSKTIQNELRTQFIPKLAELVHYKDETEVSFRIPIAVTVIKLITMLPREEAQIAAAPVILDIAQILRSRTQEARDVARNALCQIVLLLDPSSLQFVLKELRTALTRGYQLHVLSFVMHAILVFITPSTKLGELDYCVDDLVAVVMDDIFGAVGQEKNNEDYISSMKEVKSSKSYDSMELLAKTISTQALSRLVVPIQTLLVGNMTTKQVRQVDELLRRLGMGLSQNPGASKRDLLLFAYQLIQAIYKEKEFKPEQRRTTLDEKSRQRYLIQLSTANKRTTSQTSHLLYKLARFALDLVRSIVQKHDDVLTVENIHGFLPVIGDALVEAQEDVKISALRLLSAVVKLPMPELDENGPLYMMEAVKVVKNCTNTNEEAAQAALKFVSALLRERKSVKVRDSDIADLLHRLTPDIEEPDRQGVTFNFVRAVMARKIQLPEIYELVDKIGIMMVTNQNKGARDIARGVYVHFLLEYPQSSARWSKQQKFLLKNLEYEYPEGRQSVMESINTLILKTKGSAAQDLISTFFVPIVLRMVNDENKGCREMAGVLLGQIFRSADQSHLKELLEPLRSWVGQDDNKALQNVSWQAYNILLASNVALDREEISNIRDNLGTMLQKSQADDEDNDGQEWELCFQALLCMSKLVDTNPEAVLNQKQARIWSVVWQLLSHANPWIQGTAATLTCEFFRHCVDADHSKLPLVCDHGLRFDSDSFLQTLKSAVRILRRTERNEDLSSQAVQILLFLGQCMNVNGLTMEVADKSANDEDGDVLDDEAVSDDDDHPATTRTKKISGLQYLLDQVARILRVEITSLTSAALLPKKSVLVLLSNLLPTLALEHLTAGTRVHDILAPLQHLTDPNTIMPRSADPTFIATYQGLIELAHEVMEKVQSKLGDQEYVKIVTEVSRSMRARREERRTKRRIERVAEPERAAREKKRKSDRKKERNREIARTHQRRRREVG
ncbi:U3 snoRNP protein [Elasticomyces elasticus]|uniref:U3 snoRNP protein n=1 Tax=Exophiala sideris TaxID=1016849 RepID=A0ABR0JSK7_9EURO|nr:U3 snoRNP protein [Elasticomyces elasticus]KAK5034627.1 U3 snoRNP protein [Exophiala sideris]KAK5040051.1 U3 snoRNP protein [Exophiala sideris]KAK5068429.1 U3 snoRNP protein [Exophiala sideris]KAK5187731.1 U3 snoRNP protein [Eurotiomycetes sp. CCFEE 6388]